MYEEGKCNADECLIDLKTKKASACGFGKKCEDTGVSLEARVDGLDISGVNVGKCVEATV